MATDERVVLATVTTTSPTEVDSAAVEAVATGALTEAAVDVAVWAAAPVAISAVVSAVAVSRWLRRKQRIVIGDRPSVIIMNWSAGNRRRRRLCHGSMKLV
jgi:hypothetical protein